MSAPVPATTPSFDWRWVALDDAARWREAVDAVGGDVFHRAWFHRLARSRGEGLPRLFVFRSAQARVVLPLLLRPIPGSDDIDATSVYGYAGPASVGARTPATVRVFQAALRSSLREAGVLSVFSRMHPLRDESGWLAGLGAMQLGGDTVSIDLRPSPSQRRAGYRGSHRREIARLHREGYTVQDESAVEEFADLYAAAMARLGAASRYAFCTEQLRAMTHEGGMRLFVVRKGRALAAAGLFTDGASGSHYFLSGTDPAHRKLAPSKAMIDAACDWARARGAQWMHLGGGVGGADDALFRFKAGFSSRRHVFRTWRWIVRPSAYRSHCERRGVPLDSDFFPAYRSPAKTLTEAEDSPD